MNNPLKRNMDPQTCDQIFMAIKERQIIALMFHDQSADLFDFLGLKGFKRMHEYQYLVESIEHRKLSRYYLNHHNKLLMDTPLDNPEVIPLEWGKYTRFEVTAQVRKQAIEKSFSDYYDWESETLELYSKYAKQLLDMGKVADFNQVNCLIKDVDMELKYLGRTILDLKSISYDLIQVESMQQGLHDHYRDMMREIEIP